MINTNKQRVLRTAIIAMASFVSLLAVLIVTPQLTTQFGISAYAANKIIDIASGAGSVWAVLAVVGGSAGWGAALLAAAKILLKKYGKIAAASW